MSRLRRAAAPGSAVLGAIALAVPLSAGAAAESGAEPEGSGPTAAGADPATAPDAAPPPSPLSRPPSFGRNGAYLGLGVNYAIEDFRTRSFDVSSSRGLRGRLGIRLHPAFAAEAQFDWFEGFDFRNGSVRGDVEGWSAIAVGKLYITEARVQPYLGLGFGAIELDVDLEGGDDPGARLEFAASALLGLDLYLTRNVAWTLEASYVGPAGDLDAIRFVTLHSGLSFRF